MWSNRIKDINGWCPYKDRDSERDRHTRKRNTAIESKSRDWSDAAIGQGMPSISGHNLEQAKGQEGFLFRAFRGRVTLLTP